MPVTPVYQLGLVNPILQQPHLNPVPQQQAVGITLNSGLPLPSSAAASHPLLGLQQAGLREASGMLGQVPPLSEAFVVGPGVFAYTLQVSRCHYVGSICRILILVG